MPLTGPAIVLVLSGGLRAEGTSGAIELARGDAAFVSAGRDDADLHGQRDRGGGDDSLSRCLRAVCWGSSAPAAGASCGRSSACRIGAAGRWRGASGADRGWRSVPSWGGGPAAGRRTGSPRRSSARRANLRRGFGRPVGSRTAGRCDRVRPRSRRLLAISAGTLRRARRRAFEATPCRTEDPVSSGGWACADGPPLDTRILCSAHRRPACGMAEGAGGASAARTCAPAHPDRLLPKQGGGKLATAPRRHGATAPRRHGCTAARLHGSQRHAVRPTTTSLIAA